MKRIVKWMAVFKRWYDFKTRTLLAVALLASASPAAADPNVFIGEASVAENSSVSIHGQWQPDRAYRSQLAYSQIIIASTDFHYRGGVLILKVSGVTTYQQLDHGPMYRAVSDVTTFYPAGLPRYKMTNSVTAPKHTYWPYRGVGTRVALPPGRKTVSSQSIQALVADNTSENLRYRVMAHMRGQDGTASNLDPRYVKGEEVAFSSISLEEINRLRGEPTKWAELTGFDIYRDEP